jgi:hypothetical protein
VVVQEIVWVLLCWTTLNVSRVYYLFIGLLLTGGLDSGDRASVPGIGNFDRMDADG